MSEITAAQEQVPEKRWYSIQEAAEYLEVSQPTIFRWLKQGILSYYKVGGATRFSKDGLDAVIQKMTGLREAETVAGRCAACGHSVLVEGQLQGTGKLYFRPAKTKFWVFSEALVPTRARVCPSCGYVQINVDIQKLGRLMPASAEDARGQTDQSPAERGTKSARGGKE